MKFHYLINTALVIGVVAVGVPSHALEKKEKAAKPTVTPSAKGTPSVKGTPALTQKTQASLTGMKDSKEPTYISADQLTINSTARVFTYKGNVVVSQGDMTLKSDTLEGHYGEDNKIKDLVARKNIVITKGPSIKATSEKAIYDAQSETVTLTESPELIQEGSTLSADVVKVFLRENRSTALGQVKMKIVKGTDTDLLKMNK